MDRVTIEPAENGFILRYDDDKIRMENRKPNARWKDPEIKKVYPDEASMVQDLSTILPTLKPRAEDDYSEAFNEAVKVHDDD